MMSITAESPETSVLQTRSAHKAYAQIPHRHAFLRKNGAMATVSTLRVIPITAVNATGHAKVMKHAGTATASWAAPRGLHAVSPVSALTSCVTVNIVAIVIPFAAITCSAPIIRASASWDTTTVTEIRPTDANPSRHAKPFHSLPRVMAHVPRLRLVSTSFVSITQTSAEPVIPHVMKEKHVSTRNVWTTQTSSIPAILSVFPIRRASWENVWTMPRKTSAIRRVAPIKHAFKANASRTPRPVSPTNPCASENVLIYPMIMNTAETA